jgi:hypothetical protein
MSSPNLFLIGAPESGSTTLAAHLGSHPDIAMRTKEPNILNAPDLETCRQRLANYADSTLTQRWIMDGSVNYSQYPKFRDVPQHINALSDGSRLRFIYMLRNPVDRTISQYFWRREHFGEERPFEKACTPESVYIMSSRYDVQIQKYLEVFRPDQFYFIKHDTYFEDVSHAFSDLYRWLEIDDTHAPDVNLQAAATSKGQTRAARFPLFNRLLRASPGLRRQITSKLPYHRQQKLAQVLSKPARRPEITPQQRRFVWTHLQDTVAKTETLTKLDPSDWRA